MTLFLSVSSSSASFLYIASIASCLRVVEVSHQAASSPHHFHVQMPSCSLALAIHSAQSAVSEELIKHEPWTPREHRLISCRSAQRSTAAKSAQQRLLFLLKQGQG